MTRLQAGQWPHYTYIVPHIYTKAKVRLIGLGNYAPTGTITNEYFAYISTRLGDPRSADDLERVTGLSTRHVRASTLELCRKMAGADAPGRRNLLLPPERPDDDPRHNGFHRVTCRRIPLRRLRTAIHRYVRDERRRRLRR